AKVERFATGVGIPTQIAFNGKTAFVSGAAEGPFKGGVFAVRPGSRKAVKVKGTPRSAFGIATRRGKVYVSAGRNVFRYSRYDGKRFRGVKKIYSGPKAFSGFSGLAFGPNGRLYAGVSLNQKYDHEKDPSLYGNSVVSMNTNGNNLKVVSTGLRQPWMMTFAKGSRNPFVSVLGQDLPENNGAPDLIVNAAPGSNFGFPECSWLSVAPCEGFTEPLLELDPVPGENGSLSQQSPMGIGSIGDRLIVALFNGAGQGPSVLEVGSDGKGAKPFMTGFAAPVLSVATHKGKVYAGDLTGTIYRVKG
ncbi:MAG: hypothetical protein M3Y23_06595, partial [Actinomycetota bacterium]|nr:hypothetical protein [Actinomycetota bacterium]